MYGLYLVKRNNTTIHINPIGIPTREEITYTILYPPDVRIKEEAEVRDEIVTLENKKIKDKE